MPSARTGSCAIRAGPYISLYRPGCLHDAPSRTPRTSDAAAEGESQHADPKPPDSKLARSGEFSPGDADKTKPKKAPKVMLGFLPQRLSLALWCGFSAAARSSTDDAQVEGHVVTVSVRTPGQVAKVLVTDNQIVKEGDVLVELDLDELKARLAVAKADRLAAEATLALARAQLDLTQRTTTLRFDKLAVASLKQLRVLSRRRLNSSKPKPTS